MSTNDNTSQEIELCEKCGLNEADPPHTCAYEDEMQMPWERDEDYQCLCNCCSDCTYQCFLST